jgi:aconitate hydratase 2/2-methylisocitrate dehydratase
MLEAYHQHVADRAKLGILPLNAQQTAELCEMLKNPPKELKGDSSYPTPIPTLNRLSMLGPTALGLGTCVGIISQPENRSVEESDQP